MLRRMIVAGLAFLTVSSSSRASSDATSAVTTGARTGVTKTAASVTKDGVSEPAGSRHQILELRRHRNHLGAHQLDRPGRRRVIHP